MNRLTVEDAVRACNGTLLKGDRKQYITGACIDSRILEKGELFAAVRGENTDGHRFVGQVSAKGASAVLISDETYADDAECAVILCGDTTKALQDIAECYRNMMDIRIIGVTGSVGKTSTADLVKAVCSVKYRTAKTKGNFNNHLGLPITLLSFDPDTQIGVLEMGMDKPGEIDFLADLARPDIEIITNVGIAHIETLGTRENIFRAKMEITDFFGPDNVLVVNGNDEYLSQLCDTPYRLDKVGSNGGCRYYLYDIEDRGEGGIEFTFEYDEKTVRVSLPVYGRHNAMNASLAIAAGIELGIDPLDAAEGLAKTKLTDKRLSIKGRNGIKIIDDSYNASPDSDEASLDVQHELDVTGRRFAVLGGMRELGAYQDEGHLRCGRRAAACADVLYALGDGAEQYRDGAREAGMPDGAIRIFSSHEEMAQALRENARPGDALLFKGSRYWAMEKVLAGFFSAQENSDRK